MPATYSCQLEILNQSLNSFAPIAVDCDHANVAAGSVQRVLILLGQAAVKACFALRTTS